MDPYNSVDQPYKDRLMVIDTGEKVPQWKQVLRYMETHPCITSAIAFSELRITSLHRRLTDIERFTHYVIDRRRIQVHGRPHHYEYRLR